MREKALTVARAISIVSNGDDQKQAVEAQYVVADILKLAKTAWEEAKRPLIDYRRKMDDCAKEFIGGLEQEEVRLARAVGDFQAVELAKQRAAQQVENERLLLLEQQRAAEMAQATSVEQMDEIAQTYCDRAKAEIPVVPMPRREQGQQVREDWVIEVTDIWLLARAHPACVKIEPRVQQIKELLNAGVTVAGVRSRREVNAMVRGPKVIDV